MKVGQARTDSYISNYHRGHYVSPSASWPTKTNLINQFSDFIKIVKHENVYLIIPEHTTIKKTNQHFITQLFIIKITSPSHRTEMNTGYGCLTVLCIVFGNCQSNWFLSKRLAVWQILWIVKIPIYWHNQIVVFHSQWCSVGARLVNLIIAKWGVEHAYFSTLLFKKPFIPFHHIDAFWSLCSRPLFENMAAKEEIAQNKQFLLLSTCFSTRFNYCNLI